jgi:hypothetical protein
MSSTIVLSKDVEVSVENASTDVLDRIDFRVTPQTFARNATHPFGLLLACKFDRERYLRTRPKMPFSFGDAKDASARKVATKRPRSRAAALPLPSCLESAPSRVPLSRSGETSACSTAALRRYSAFSPQRFALHYCGPTAISSAGRPQNTRKPCLRPKVSVANIVRSFP